VLFKNLIEMLPLVKSLMESAAVASHKPHRWGPVATFLSRSAGVVRCLTLINLYFLVPGYSKIGG
jgi:hypothetical protein